eukprot:gene17113-22627_t
MISSGYPVIQPFLKQTKQMTKRLSSSDKLAQSHRVGNRATIYSVIKDPQLKNKNIIRDKNVVVFPFITGSKYKGEWKNDKKDGFGKEISPNGNVYTGEWADDLYHGRGTLWVKKDKKLKHLYVGDWANGLKEGFGVYYYDNEDVYQGEWKNDKRCGNGKLSYKNGDYYLGEWADDYQNGLGALHLLNGNIYEGMWLNGKKEGIGRFFYASTGKVYEGEWSDDQARCGIYREPTQIEELRFEKSLIRKQDYTLPEIRLKDPKNVLSESLAILRADNAFKRGTVSHISEEDSSDAINII